MSTNTFSPLTLPDDVPVSWSDALRLRDTPICLDAARAHTFCFITNARTLRRIRRVSAQRLCYAADTGIFSGIPQGSGSPALPAPFARPFTLGGMTLTALPSGHIAGSSMLLVERTVGNDQERVLFTGAFNPKGSLFADAARPVDCDTLVIDATHGTPSHLLPSRSLALRSLLDTIHDALVRGKVVEVHGDPYGSLLDVAVFVHAAGMPLFGFPAVVRQSRRLEALGYRVPTIHPLTHDKSEMGVQLHPAERLTGPALHDARRPRLRVLLSGEATGSEALTRCRADHVLALSDHGGFDDIVAFALACKPKRVVTVNGHAATLAQELRARGIREAWALTPTTQQADLFGRTRGEHRVVVGGRGETRPELVGARAATVTPIHAPVRARTRR